MKDFVELPLVAGIRAMIRKSAVVSLTESIEDKRHTILTTEDCGPDEFFSVAIPYDKVKELLFGTESDDSVEQQRCYESVKSLESCTWAEIAEISKNGWYDERTGEWCTGDVNVPVYMFKVGDEKTITLTDGTSVTVQIYGFQHDETDPGKKVGITFGLKNAICISRMNRDATNKESWRDSVIRTDTLEKYYDLLPQEVKDVILPVRKKTIEGNYSSDVIETFDDLFLFAYAEVFDTEWDVYQQEGEKYPIFTDETSRMKRLGDDANSSACWWWLRSPRYGNGDDFRTVGSGGWDHNHGANHGGGVVFGFCV